MDQKMLDIAIGSLELQLEVYRSALDDYRDALSGCKSTKSKLYTVFQADVETASGLVADAEKALAYFRSIRDSL